MQLENTVRALFPFELTLPKMPARPRGKHAFSTAHLTNEFTYNQVSAMTEAAEQIAAQAHDRLDELMPCAVDTGGEACVGTFLDDFGARAYRRPLESDEKTELLSLYRELVTDGLSPAMGTTAVIAAILQSPQFLYQLDLGPAGASTGDFALTGEEVAAHLSYLILDAPPDETLRALARDGSLADPAVVRAQAERLLEDPRGRAMAKRFVAEWFDVAGVDYGTRLSPALADAFVEEFDRDLDAWLLGDDRVPIPELLTRTDSYVNGTLAAHYGITSGAPTSAAEFRRVELPAPYRGGLLTKALVATRYANLSEPSVILRGVFVLTELLCVKLGTPPNDAVDRNPELPPGSLPRERSEARNALDPCGNCHSKIDPVGLGMEELDQLGRYREIYEGGEPVDNAGELSLFEPPAFSGTAELAQAIAGTPEFRQCVAQQWTEYVFGEVLPQSTCTAPTLAASLEGGEGTFEELILSAVQSEAFLRRRRSD